MLVRDWSEAEASEVVSDVASLSLAEDVDSLGGGSKHCEPSL